MILIYVVINQNAAPGFQKLFGVGENQHKNICQPPGEFPGIFRDWGEPPGEFPGISPAIRNNPKLTCPKLRGILQNVIRRISGNQPAKFQKPPERGLMHQ